MIEFENIVKLVTFQGLSTAPENTASSEDFWQLIGEQGSVVSKIQKTHPAFPKKGKRALVQFNKDISSLGLPCHNETSNALWIFVSDLRKVD